MSVKVRLGIMMFLQYAIWGAWSPVLSAYLENTLHFSGIQIGVIYSLLPLATIIAPFIGGQFADRYFSSEKVIAVLQLLGRIIRINAVKNLEVKYTNRQQTLAYIASCFKELGVTVLDVNFHVENLQSLDQPGTMLFTNLYTLHLSGKAHYSDIVTKLSEYQDILTVRTRDA